MTAQVAQHRQPRVGGMGGGRAHRVLHHLSARRRGVRADQVDVEQQRGGEVADQRVDVRVQGLAPEQRNIQQEAGIGRPAGQRVGEPRGQRHRRGDAARLGAGEQCVAGLRIQPVPAPGAAVCAAAGGDRQGRRIRQLRQTACPPVPVGVPARLRLRVLRLDGVAVLPVGVAQFRQIASAVQRRQIGHQGAIAHRVGGLHVQIDVQPRPPTRQQGHGQLEHRAVELLVRFGLAQRGEPPLDLVGAQLAQILDVHREVTAFHRRGDALGAVGQKPHAQHRVATGQRGGRRPQPARVEKAGVELHVEVPGHPAEPLVVLAAHPHGVLHRGQGKRLVLARRGPG